MQSSAAVIGRLTRSMRVSHSSCSSLESTSSAFETRCCASTTRQVRGERASLESPKASRPYTGRHRSVPRVRIRCGDCTDMIILRVHHARAFARFLQPVHRATGTISGKGARARRLSGQVEPLPVRRRETEASLVPMISARCRCGDRVSRRQRELPSPEPGRLREAHLAASYICKLFNKSCMCKTVISS